MVINLVEVRLEKRTKLHIFAVIYKSSKLLLSKKMTGYIILLFDKKLLRAMICE